MKMIVALRLKKILIFFQKIFLYFVKWNPLKKASYISGGNFPYFWKKLLFWEMKVFFLRKGLANPEKTKDYLHSSG